MKRRVCTLLLVAGMTVTMVGCKLPWEETDHTPKVIVEDTEETEEAEDTDTLEAIPYQIDHSANTVTYSDTNYGLVAVSYDTIRLGDYEGDAFVATTEYPKLTASIEAFNTQMKNEAEDEEQVLTSTANTDISSGMIEAPDVDAEDGEYTDYTDLYSYDATVEISRADAQVFSMFLYTYEFRNGAHPSTYATGYNYDSKTGDKLELKELVTDQTAFVEAVEKELSLQNGDYVSAISDNLLVDDLESYFTEALEGDTLQWVFSNDGIKIYINTYDVAVYAAGPATVDLSFEKYGDLFQESYQEVPEDYVETLRTYRTYTIGDTSLYIKEDSGDSDYINRLEFYYGQDPSTEETPDYTIEDTYCYDVKYYHFHKEDQDYIYVDTKVENDYHDLIILDLNGSHITEVENPLVEVALYQFIPSDPDRFLVASRMDLLSTYLAYRHAAVGSTGQLEFSGEYYMVEQDDSRPLKALQNFNAVQLSTDSVEDFSDTEDGTKVEIMAGTTLYIYRTDGDEIVDLKDSAGNIYRITITKDNTTGNYGQTVNGTAIEELFDGLVFAG